jgi:hypothetical protein
VGPPQQPLPFGPPPMGLPPLTQYPEPDRSALVLILGSMGILTIFFGCMICGPLALGALGFSIPAILMGKKDLKAIQDGRMSPNSRDATMIGYVLGIVSAAMSLLLGIVFVVIFAFYGAVIIAAIVGNQSGM